MQRKLISFDWAIKRILRSKANFESYQKSLHDQASANESTYVTETIEGAKKKS